MAMKKYMIVALAFTMLVGWISPGFVSASEAAFSTQQSSRKLIEIRPASDEKVEIPQVATDTLSLDWLSRNYEISKTDIMDQLGRGYQLTEIYRALKNDVDGQHLQEELAKINPSMKAKQDQVQAALEQLEVKNRLEQAADNSSADAELSKFLKKPATKMKPGAKKVESPERFTQEIGSAESSGSALRSSGVSALAASDPPLPNLASNYDQAAAGQMNVRTDQAPYSIANGGESISSITGDLEIRDTDLTLPGRNGLSFSLDRVYRSSEAKYFKDDAKYRIYQRKWLFPVVTLYIEAVDQNGIHHSSGVNPVTFVWQPESVLYENIYWEFTPPALFGFEYMDENNLLHSAEDQMQEYMNYSPWRGYVTYNGITIYYYMYPTGQVIELPTENESLTAGYQNQPTLTYDEEKRFPLGKGWSWDISYIKFEGDKKYISISGTGTYEISSSNTLIGYPWKDLAFASDSTVTVNGKTSAYVLKSISGIKQYFASDGRLIRKADNYGNTIDFQYTSVSPYGLVLTKVTDALQNTINIAYTNTVITLTSGDRTVVYNKGDASADKQFLSSVTDAEGRETYYGYHVEHTNYNLLGSGYADGENYSLLLDTIHHPTVAQTKYTYNASRQQLGQNASEDMWYVTSREDSVSYTDGTRETGNHINFTHSAFPGSSYGVDTSFTSTVNDGLRQITYTYKKDFIDANTPAAFYNTQLVEQVGTATRTRTQTFDETRKLPVPNQSTTQYKEGSSSTQAVTTSATYDDYGNVLASTGPLGETSTYVYDNATHLLKSESRPAPSNLIQYSEYTRNTQGTITDIKVRDNNASGALKQHISFGVDTYGNISQVTIQDDTRNTVISYEYGSQYKYGFPTKQSMSVTDVNGQASTIIQSMEYNPLAGQLTKLIDGNGHATILAYDKLGRVKQQKLADGSQTNVVYDDVQNSVTATDMMGRITQTIYNPFGWLEYQTMGLGYASYGYDAYGRQIWSEDAKRQRTQYQYDAWGRLVKTTNADSSTVQTQYDDLHYTTTTTDEGNHAIRSVYDKLGRLLRTEELRASGVVVLSSSTYDKLGNVFSTTDASSNTTHYEYDVLGRLITVTDAEDQATHYIYSMTNNLTQIRYPDSNTRIKTYDEIGRLIQETDPTGKVDKYKYDAAGNLVQSIDRKGQVANLTYDNRNFLKTSITTDETISYTYDAEGKRLSMTDATGTTGYSYYSNSARLQSITYPDGIQMQFDYDVQSMESRYILSDSRVAYGYDVRNRVNDIQIQRHDHLEGDHWFVYTAGEIHNTFNSDNTLTQTSYNDGLFVKNYTYAGFNLSSLSYKKADQFGIASFQYGYDDNRNITTRTENGQSAGFTYDALQRIKTSSLFNESYQYDELGNRQTLSSDLELTVPFTSYQYNDRNQLIKVTNSNGQVVHYRYNGDGLLWERIEDGVTTRYYYDEQGNLFREGIVQANGSVTLTARYIYGGQGSGPVARDDIASGVVLYYVNNGHGDITGVVDGVGNIVNQYSYDIWGNPLSASELVTTPFRYAGEYWDDTTGLQYLRARWYDPSVGRFINEDTYEGELNNPLSLNLYTYVGNNPLMYSDPSGHKWNLLRLAWNATRRAVVNGATATYNYFIGDDLNTILDLDSTYEERNRASLMLAINFVPGEGQLLKFGEKEALKILQKQIFKQFGIKIAESSAVINALSKFESKTMQFGSQKFLLDKSGMTHILERHHPDFWNGTISSTQTFFNKKMSIADVESAIQAIMTQNRNKLIEKGTTGMYQIEGKYNGVEYVLGLNNGRVGQFYAKP